MPQTRLCKSPSMEPSWVVPDQIVEEINELQHVLEKEHHLEPRTAFSEAVSLLMQESEHVPMQHLPESVKRLVRSTQEHLAADEIDFATTAIDARYRWIAFAAVSSYFINQQQCSPHSISRNFSWIPPRGIAA